MSNLLDIGPAGDMLDHLNEWVAVESPTADPAAVNRMADRVEADFRALGAAIDRVPGTDGRGDHLVIRAPWNGAGGTGILVVGHLDTVHPVGALALNPIRQEDGRAYGPGIADMKGGNMLAYMSLRKLAEAGATTPLPVTIVLVADEETGSTTSRGLIERLAAEARYALVLEPARAGGRIVTARKGVGRFRVEVTGRPSHSGNAHAAGRSALRELAAQILALEAMTDHSRGITVNVGMAGGGTAENTVPEQAFATIDLRVPTEDDASAMTARILGLTPQFPGTTVTVTGGMNRTAYRRTDRPDISALFDHSAALAGGIGFELRDLPDGEGSGGSDGQFCVPYVPALDGLGPVGAELHSNGEYLEIASLRERGQLVLHLLQTLE